MANSRVRRLAVAVSVVLVAATCGVIAPVSYAQGTADVTDRAGRLIGTTRRYIADTTYAYGTVTAPLAGGVVATITPGAGTYEVTVETAYGATADVANNMQLQVGAAVIGTLTVQAVANGQAVSRRFPRLTVAAATAVTVNAIAAGAVGSVYFATIMLTPVTP